jgi:hypothetical protein
MKWELDENTLLKVSGAASLVYGLSAASVPRNFHDVYHTSVSEVQGRQQLLPQGSACGHSFWHVASKQPWTRLPSVNGQYPAVCCLPEPALRCNHCLKRATPAPANSDSAAPVIVGPRCSPSNFLPAYA